MSSSLPYYQQGSRRVNAPDAANHRLMRRGESGIYTLSHRGRQLRLRPLVFWLVLGLLAIMTAWTVTTVTYFAFREDVLTRLIARQAEIQFGYEDRIAELRSQVDRISSRQLLDQEQYEQQIGQILRRQSALESRANALSGLSDVTSSIRPPARTLVPGKAGTLGLKPPPTTDKGTFLLPGERDSSPVRNLASGGGTAAVIARLQSSLDRVERRQVSALASMEEQYFSRAQQIRSVLSELGVGSNGTAVLRHAAGMGGPFVPVQLSKDSTGFEQRLFRIDTARTQVDRLTRVLHSLPVRRPLDGAVDLVSGFGVRQDPFTGGPAMHTGIDIHAEPGQAVRASADGTVAAAGWSGGYGRAVDIDHGNGLLTRYGHLSTIEVRVGQSIKSGQIIGRVGSTGRSTGPHLHYETRVKGEAVDPQKFLRAGERLGT
jgi:murein DD-endopeptidase MepM/ murein hydrolase activator NlpD